MRFLAILTIFFSLTCAANAQGPIAPKAKNRGYIPPCLQKVIYPRVENKVFAIPQPEFKWSEPFMPVKEGVFDCQKQAYPPFDVTRFMWLPENDFSRQFPHAPGLAMQLGIGTVANPPDEQERHNFKNVKMALYDWKIPIKKLPVEKGFYVYHADRTKGYSRERITPQWSFFLYRSDVYIAKEPELVSGTGDPVVFVCRVKNCNTSFQRGNIIFAAKNIDLDATTMKKFFKSFIAYIESTEVKNLAEVPPGPLMKNQKRSDECHKLTDRLTAGMSRAEMESAGLSYDGGLTGVYKSARMFFGKIQSSKTNQQKLCMVNIDFRPKDISDDIYNNQIRFVNWVRHQHFQPSPDDVAVRISEPYLDVYHAD